MPPTKHFNILQATFLALTIFTFAGYLIGQETMQNSDFSDGSTYWHGDCKPLASDLTTDFTSSSASDAKGIIVELHSSSWTKVTQDIHEYKGASNGRLLLTIVYQTSPDFKLSDRASDYNGIGPALGFGGAQLFGNAGHAFAFIDVLPISRTSVTSSGSVDTYTIHPDAVSSAQFAPKADGQKQTFTTDLTALMATSDSKPTFCLGFPPGSGSVTILKISLTPAQGGGFRSARNAFPSRDALPSLVVTPQSASSGTGGREWAGNSS